MEQEKNKESKKENLALQVVSAMGRIAKSAVTYLGRQAFGIRDAFWQIAEEKSDLKGFQKTLLFVLALIGLLLCAAVLALAKFPLKVYPGGFALLSALGGVGKFRSDLLSEKNARLLESALLLTAFSGVLFSCLWIPENGFVYLISYLILFLCRAGITGGRFQDSILSRVTVSAAVATGTGLVLAALERFSVNRIFGAVSFGILTPLLTYLLCGFYIFTTAGSLGEGAKVRRRVYLEATLFTLVYLFLYSLREVSVLNFRLSFVLAVMATLLIARERGALYGAAMGMIGGMACAEAAVAPALAVAGFFSGLFFEYSGTVALMVSFVASCGYSMYSGGMRAFGAVSFDFLCGVILFAPLLYRLPPREERCHRSAVREVFHRETMNCAKEKLKHMSDAFSSLSQVFYTVSDSMKKPQLTESSRLVTDCCSRICSRCDRSGTCWGEEHLEHVDATSKVAAKLLEKGKVTPRDFPSPFENRCKNLEVLAELVNRRFDEINGKFAKNNKTRMLAGEYSSVSRLLKSTVGELDQELEYSPQLERRAASVLKKLGISYGRVAVFGTREVKIDVYGVQLERMNLATDDLVGAFEKEFECRFETPNFLMFEESVVMRLRRRRCLSLECAKSGCSKKGEVMNGDSACFFETKRNYFYTLICDGMGSGREAAFTSRLASIFIEKLMNCATPKNVTLEMLNAFLMSKTDETFTTVDLLEVDLLSGQANFIKAGAAPSFVLRGDRIHRIESRTPPAGILYRMCAEQTAFRLCDGDFVVQLSDGADAAEDGGWLVALLSQATFENAQVLCEAIFEKAKEEGAFRDDLSVCVVRVSEN